MVAHSAEVGALYQFICLVYLGWLGKKGRARAKEGKHLDQQGAQQQRKEPSSLSLS